jgi:hypothetical protein
MLINDIYYREVRDSFIVPLVEAISEDLAYLLNPDTNEKLLLSFYVLTAIPVFNNETSIELKL